MNGERSLSKLQITFILLFLAVGAFIYIDLKTSAEQHYQQIEKSLRQQLESQRISAQREASRYDITDLKLDVVNSQRFSRIFQGVLSRGTAEDDTQLLLFMRNVKKALDAHAVDGVYHYALSRGIGVPVGLYDASDNTIQFHGQWELTVKNKESPWLTRFPRQPFLALHNEIVPWPTCEQGETPSFIAENVNKTGQDPNWDIDIRMLPSLSAWQFSFSDTPLDITALKNRRALVFSFCQQQEE